MLLKKVVSAAVPAMIAAAAFFQAHAVGALVDASMPAASIAPFKEARAASSSPVLNHDRTASAQVILDRNVFDSTAKPAKPAKDAPLEATDIVDGDPLRVPICEGVRAVVTVRASEPSSSFAALDVGGKRLLRKRGGEIGDLRLAYVGADRVWLERDGALCQAPTFGPKPAAATKPETRATSASPLEREIAKQIQKTGPHEYAIDRGAVSRILEAQAELMKTPLAPEKQGDQVVGYRLLKVKPGSVLATLGLESGDRLESIDNVPVTSPEGMMQAYARLSTGTLSHLVIHVTRRGAPLNLDYAIK